MALIKHDDPISPPIRSDERPQVDPETRTQIDHPGSAPPDGPSRATWDRIVSGAGAVLAVALIVIGASAVYGGNFGRENVQDRLRPEKVVFPPLDAMTPEEKVELGAFAGQTVDTGPEAEGFARYIEGHLAETNDGKSYAETSSAAREEGLAPDAAAELQAKADSLFKGETLRSILLNAYGWWTVATIAMYVGLALIVGGLLLGIMSFLGFRHARRSGSGRQVA